MMARLPGLGALKFRLLTDGVLVEQAAESAWRESFDGPLTLAEYATTSGVTIVLPGSLYVNAPLTTRLDVPQLGVDDEGFILRASGEALRVDVVPVPAYHGRTRIDDADGVERPLTAFGVTHTDRVRVSPISGCAWRCEFCDLPYEFDYRRRDADGLLAAIVAAREDALVPARHVLISGGTPRAPTAARNGRAGRDDEAWIDEMYAHLAERSPIPVDVMLAPRRDLSHPHWLRSVGVNMLSVNMEVSDPGRARAIAPAKAQIGREHFLAYVERAVDAFGVGAVQSLLVVGSAIEPLGESLKGVRALVQRGCVPVLSAFRPHHLTPMANAAPASFDEIVKLYEETMEICARWGEGIWPGPRCVACHHNTVTLPDDSGFYLQSDQDLVEGRCLTS